MTTVITLPGLGGWAALPNAWFKRALTTIGNPIPDCLESGFGPVSKVINLQYNQLNPITAAQGINDTLNALPFREPAIVTGHSEGALGVVYWHWYYSYRSFRDPARTLFVTSGAGRKIKEPSPSVREGRYRTVDVTVGYDEIADEPNVPTSPFFQQAVDNARQLKIHTGGYQSLDLTSPHRKSVNGQVTYLFYDTCYIANAIAASKQEIDTAYDRRWLV